VCRSPAFGTEYFKEIIGYFRGNFGRGRDVPNQTIYISTFSVMEGPTLKDIALKVVAMVGKLSIEVTNLTWIAMAHRPVYIFAFLCTNKHFVANHKCLPP
jgi:hypothetical protein